MRLPRPPGHREAVAETRLQDEAAQRHVRGVLQRHERRIQRGEHERAPAIGAGGQK